MTTIDSRTRDEASIKRLNTTFGREFDKALDRVIERNRGLNWFTDEQIAEIRAEMVLEARAAQLRIRKYRETARAFLAKTGGA